MRTITRMYDSYGDASAAVNELEIAHIPHDRISLIANADAHGRYSTESSGESSLDPANRDDSDSGAGTKRGAVAGGLVGGAVGLLTGIGALAIPGVGPIVAAGWLVATLAGAGVGAAGGGLVGALTGAGVHPDEANVYAEGVKRGGSLVTIRAEEGEIADVERILDGREPVNWQERRATYGSDWSGAENTSAAAYPDRATTERPITDDRLTGRG